MTNISVITATWNSESTIVDCLNSVANQTIDNIEHVVVDGASTDATLSILKTHTSIDILISEPDDGIYDALNKGIRASTGDIVGFLHADDMFAYDDALANVLQIFQENPEVSAVYGDLQYIPSSDVDKIVRFWKSGEFSNKKLHWGWMPPHPTLYVRREWYEEIGFFDTKYRVSADYLSILQLFSNSSFNAAYLPRVMVKMRLGGASNRNLRAIIIKTYEDFSALRQARVGSLGGIGTILWKNISKVGQFF